MGLKLTGIARVSLEELLGDYRDFLRQRGLAEWGKNHPMARMVRRLAYAPNRSYKTYATYIENAPPEVAANTMLCLVHQANYLLDQQLHELEQAFLRDGGFTERLHRARQQTRLSKTSSPKNSSNRSYVSPGKQAMPKPGL
jgi:four helix bundle suffix protein